MNVSCQNLELHSRAVESNIIRDRIIAAVNLSPIKHLSSRRFMTQYVKKFFASLEQMSVSK